MSTQLSYTLALPARFRSRDILDFHRRDPNQASERVSGTMLQKGLVWGELPACLTIHFCDDSARAELAIDGAAPDASLPVFESMVRRMLGLTQDIDAFEQRWREHSPLGELIALQSGLRVPLAASPFEALTWAITGQQISLGAAISIRRRLIETAGIRHSGGLLCYPDANRITRLTEPTLRSAGLSTAKARTLLALSEKVSGGSVPLDEWLSDPPIDTIRATLLAVPGIGPWTIDYALLRGFGWLDGSLHGDAAVRRKLAILLASHEKLNADHVRDWLTTFAPWRALVAAHLWAMPAASDVAPRLGQRSG